jgi:hypothetical protein
MPDSFKKVHNGEKLKIPARAYNAMIDAAQDYINRKSNQSSDTGTSLPPNMVFVKNTTGAAVDRLNVLGIGGSEIDPAANTFKQSIVFTGVVPTSEHINGRFLITAEPIAPNSIGKAYASGFTIVQLNIIDEGHGFADIKDSDVTQLESVATGPAVILHKEEGTGSKLAIVRFGGSGGGNTATELWAKIIVSPTPQDPYASSDSPEYTGNPYIVRLDSSNYSQWEENHEPPYTQNTAVVDSSNNRVYIKKAGDITYPSLAPHENPADWDLSEEIKIEYALGSGKDDGSEVSVNDCVYVYPVGARVRITSRVLANQTKRYYLDETLLPVGPLDVRNITMYEGRLTAVYQ